MIFKKLGKEKERGGDEGNPSPSGRKGTKEEWKNGRNRNGNGMPENHYHNFFGNKI
jgi:hypothetical protein